MEKTMIGFDLIIGGVPQTIHTAGALPGDPPIIKLGCDMDQLTRLIHTCDEVRPFFKRFKDVAESYDNHTREMIIHEVCLGLGGCPSQPIHLQWHP